MSIASINSGRDESLAGQNLCRIGCCEHKVNMGPVECLDGRYFNLHRIVVNVVDNLITGIRVTQRWGENGHLLKPLDMRLVVRVKLFDKALSNSVGHFILKQLFSLYLTDERRKYCDAIAL